LYGVRSDDGVIMPALFIIDGECLIRRVYGPGSDAIQSVLNNAA